MCREFLLKQELFNTCADLEGGSQWYREPWKLGKQNDLYGG